MWVAATQCVLSSSEVRTSEFTIAVDPSPDKIWTIKTVQCRDENTKFQSNLNPNQLSKCQAHACILGSMVASDRDKWL